MVYIEYLTATHLLFSACHKPSIKKLGFDFVNVDNKCALCGTAINQGIAVQKVLGKTFNNWDIFYNPDGEYLCDACVFCLRTETPKIRVTEKGVAGYMAGLDWFMRCSRDELVDKLLVNIPEPPFICWINAPPPQKKHIVIRTKVNYSKKAVYVQFTEQGLVLYPEIHLPLYQAMSELSSKLGKTVLDLNKLPGWTYKKLNRDRLQKINIILNTHRYSLAYNLLTYLCPGKEKKK